MHIIKSENTGKPSLTAAFILSLFFPGAGHLFYGKNVQAILMQTLRLFPLLFIPLSSVPAYGLDTLYVFSLCFAIAVFAGPVSAVAICVSIHKKKLRASKKPGKITVVIFSFLSLILTYLAAFTAFSITYPKLLDAASTTPYLRKGDVLLINRLPGLTYNKGDLVIARVEGKLLIKRIIAQGGDSIRINSGSIEVNGSPLIRTTLPETFRNKLIINDIASVLLEKNSDIFYAVTMAPSDLKAFSGKVPDKACFLADDIRDSGYNYISVIKEDITGRIEGVLYSSDFRRILSKPGIKQHPKDEKKH